MNTEVLIAKLDELIAATRAASLPINQRWLSAESMAAMLDMAPRQFAERLGWQPLSSEFRFALLSPRRRLTLGVEARGLAPAVDVDLRSPRVAALDEGGHAAPGVIRGAVR